MRAKRPNKHSHGKNFTGNLQGDKYNQDKKKKIHLARQKLKKSRGDKKNITKAKRKGVGKSRTEYSRCLHGSKGGLTAGKIESNRQ